MKKRILSMLLVVAMIATMLVGCGSSSSDDAESTSSEGTTLEVWLPPLDDDTATNWGDLLTTWEEENNCTVNITVIN